MCLRTDQETGQQSYAQASGRNLTHQAAVTFTSDQLYLVNQHLQHYEPQDVLRWCLATLPGLYQTTAFGLSGLVVLDMLSKLECPRFPLQVIFIDTLHHFEETLSLLDRVRTTYAELDVHIYKPYETSDYASFVERHGESLWERDEDLYDWLTKVEPIQRAYADLNAIAVLTGRRRSQGDARDKIDIIEMDEAGLIKVNPLANWSYEQVRDYVTTNRVPYNELLDRGYKSVGDWHSTVPVNEGEGERAGRWRGREKTECGIHNRRSRYAGFLRPEKPAKNGNMIS